MACVVLGKHVCIIMRMHAHARGHCHQYAELPQLLMNKEREKFVQSNGHNNDVIMAIT